MTEGRTSPHSLAFGLAPNGVTYSEFPWSSPHAGDGASHPVARKPRIALRPKGRATAERITPCRACQKRTSI